MTSVMNLIFETMDLSQPAVPSGCCGSGGDGGGGGGHTDCG